jgi:predicted nucleic acid-binding protein
MTLLLDINVVLDVLLGREPWVQDAALLLSAIENGSAEGYVAGHTITTVHYLVARASDRRAAAQAVTDLLRIVRVVPLGDPDFQQALILGLEHLEDSVQAAAALRIGADYLVTRNAQEFRGFAVPVRTPGEILALLSAG